MKKYNFRWVEKNFWESSVIAESEEEAWKKISSEEFDKNSVCVDSIRDQEDLEIGEW